MSFLVSLTARKFRIKTVSYVLKAVLKCSDPCFIKVFAQLAEKRSLVQVKLVKP